MYGRSSFTSTESRLLLWAIPRPKKNLLVPLDKHAVCSIFVHHENLDLDHHRSNRLNALAKRRPPFGIVLSRSIHMLAIEDVVGAPAAAGVATGKSFFSSAAATGHPQDADPAHPGRDRSVKSLLPCATRLLDVDNPGLRFTRPQHISRRDGIFSLAVG